MKELILNLNSEGLKAAEIAQRLNCSIGTVYWHISANTRQSVLNNKRKRRREIQIHVKENIFGGKCCLCGYSKSLAALDFHHKDPSQKEGLVSKYVHEGYISKLKIELPKVILVCKNCHSEIHDGLNNELPDSPYKDGDL